MSMLAWVVVITFIAGGVGTGLGGVVGAIFKRDNTKIVSLLLALAGGVMLAIVCFDLVPSAITPSEENPANIFIVIGGTLLGTGGLVHAYQGMVKKGLETLPVTERIETARIFVEMEHRFYEHAVSVIGRCQGTILERNFAADVSLLVETAQTQAEKLMSALGEISAGRIRVKRAGDES